MRSLLSSRQFRFGVLAPIVISLSLLTASYAEGTSTMTMDPAATMGQSSRPLVVQGYCVVALLDDHAWTPGQEVFETEYDGHRYRFSSEAAKAKFLGNPNRYVPALHGRCIVTYKRTGSATPGRISYTVFHDNRMFVLSSKEAKDEFMASPLKYANADLAFGGECSVCLIDAKLHKLGSTTHVTHHQGLRYLFPNEILVNKFRQNPGKYADSSRPNPVATGMTMGATSKGKRDLVRVTGRSACALCEFGITPLGAPNELGMAVQAEDGKIYVVEDAHTKYPELYGDRESDHSLTVTGTAIKTDGNITWLKADQVVVADEG